MADGHGPFGKDVAGEIEYYKDFSLLGWNYHFHLHFKSGHAIQIHGQELNWILDGNQSELGA